MPDENKTNLQVTKYTALTGVAHLLYTVVFPGTLTAVNCLSNFPQNATDSLPRTLIHYTTWRESAVNNDEIISPLLKVVTPVLFTLTFFIAMATLCTTHNLPDTNMERLNKLEIAQYRLRKTVHSFQKTGHAVAGINIPLVFISVFLLSYYDSDMPLSVSAYMGVTALTGSGLFTLIGYFFIFFAQCFSHCCLSSDKPKLMQQEETQTGGDDRNNHVIVQVQPSEAFTPRRHSRSFSSEVRRVVEEMHVTDPWGNAISNSRRITDNSDFQTPSGDHVFTRRVEESHGKSEHQGRPPIPFTLPPHTVNGSKDSLVVEEVDDTPSPSP